MKEEEKVDWAKLGLSTDEELAEINQRMTKTEEEGLKNTLKYFDRIHDKIFKFNNILIGGYFFLAKFDSSTSYYMLLIPIINLVLIVYLDYRMMEKSRFESQIKSMPRDKIDKYGKAIDRTNQYSLLILSTTAIVTLIFLIQIYFVQKNSNVLNANTIEVSERTIESKNETDTMLIDFQKNDSVKNEQIIEVIDSNSINDTLEIKNE